MFIRELIVKYMNDNMSRFVPQDRISSDFRWQNSAKPHISKWRPRGTTCILHKKPVLARNILNADHFLWMAKKVTNITSVLNPLWIGNSEDYYISKSSQNSREFSLCQFARERVRDSD